MAASHPVTTTNSSSLSQIIMAMSSIAMASTLGFYIHPFLLVFTNHIIGSLPSMPLLQNWLTAPLLLIALLAAILLLLYTDILAQPVPKPQSNQQQHLAPSGRGGDDDDDNDLTESSDMDTALDHPQFDDSIEAAETINEVEEASAENMAPPSLAASGITQRLPRRLTRSKSERGPPTLLTSSPTDRQFSGNRRVKMVIVADPPTKEEAGEGEHDADQLNQRATDFISGFYQKAKLQR